ncbi:hypothetical protein GCM10009740_29630 [Terrabacter terrae]|uniref:DUF4439 domain-containing protein n=1 Tax=Terrabacter terrae TaxID=318434 RepID=A0ABN2UHM4_9MICO
MDGDTRGIGSRVGGGLGRPTRRLVVLGGAAAALALLVDHGLRVDVPPPPPPVPTRRRAPDELVLLAAVAGLDQVVQAEGEVLSEHQNALVRRLRTLGQEQLRALRGRLTNAGVPTSVIDAAVTRAGTRPTTPALPGTSAPGSSPSSTGMPSAAASAGTQDRTPQELGQLLRDSVGPGAWAPLTAATAGTRQLLTAAYGQRLAGALLLGCEVPAPRASPLRADLVARTAALVYAFQVVGAQSTGAQRRAAETTLSGLSSLESSLSGSTSVSPAGWALPYPVTTPRAARRLATDTLWAAVDAAAALTRSDTTATSLEDVVGWSAHLQALAVGWDLPLTAFPGASS